MGKEVFYGKCPFCNNFEYWGHTPNPNVTKSVEDPAYRDVKKKLTGHFKKVHLDKIQETIERNRKSKKLKNPINWAAGWMAAYSISRKELPDDKLMDC